MLLFFLCSIALCGFNSKLQFHGYGTSHSFGSELAYNHYTLEESLMKKLSIVAEEDLRVSV